MRFELHRWLRSKRFAVLIIVFLFSGVTSPLVSAYLEEIFEALGTADNVQVRVTSATWQDGVASYLKNAAQLALIFACYLAAWGCSLGPDDRLRIFYVSRVRRGREVFGGRLLVSGAAVAVAALVGAGVALYEVVVLFDGVDVARATAVLGVQTVGVVVVALLAGCLACLTNSAVMSTTVVYGVVLLADVVRSVEVVAEWSPTALVQPTGLLAGGDLGDTVRPLATAALLLAVAVSGVLAKRMRTVDETAPWTAGPAPRPSTEAPAPAERTTPERAGHDDRPGDRTGAEESLQGRQRRESYR